MMLEIWGGGERDLQLLVQYNRRKLGSTRNHQYRKIKKQSGS